MRGKEEIYCMHACMFQCMQRDGVLSSDGMRLDWIIWVVVFGVGRVGDCSVWLRWRWRCKVEGV